MLAVGPAANRWAAVAWLRPVAITTSAVATSAVPGRRLYWLRHHDLRRLLRGYLATQRLQGGRRWPTATKREETGRRGAQGRTQNKQNLSHLNLELCPWCDTLRHLDLHLLAVHIDHDGLSGGYAGRTRNSLRTRQILDNFPPTADYAPSSPWFRRPGLAATFAPRPTG